MTNELALVNDEVASQQDRRAALERLNTAAEEAATPEEAQAIMLQARVIAEALTAARQPLEDCWLAGKASVLAARRLGALMLPLRGEGRKRPGFRSGFGPSDRAILRSELGLDVGTGGRLVRLAKIPEPQFQRYVQRRDRIPSINGALTTCKVIHPLRGKDWSQGRRRKLGVKTPANPSLDEACSLIVRALGHLGGVMGGSGPASLARREAMDLLYQAHDRLSPFAGGYVK